MAPDDAPGGADDAAAQVAAKAAAEAAKGQDEPIGLLSGGISINKLADGIQLEKPAKEAPAPVVKKEEAPPVIPAKPTNKHFQEVLDARKKAEEERDQSKAELAAERAKWDEERTKRPPVPDEFKKQFETTLAEKQRIEKEFQGLLATRSVQAELSPRRDKAV
ncbi:MAG TPA: hypothetical protein VMQ76_04955, partial [Terracidiphilus sp.]|nr:hypothetical protein [Terracidiphilus sp.]